MIAKLTLPELFGSTINSVAVGSVTFFWFIDVVALAVYVSNNAQCIVACETAQAAEVFICLGFILWTYSNCKALIALHTHTDRLVQDLESQESLVDNMADMLSNAEGADIEFRIQDQRLRAHKCVLVARSLYFRAMFTSGMREAVEGQSSANLQVIELPDDRYKSVSLLLYYFYTGRTLMPGVVVEPVDVLVIANKYQATGLELAGELEVIRRLSKNNAADILFQYGYRYQNLRKECIRHIKENYKEITGTRAYKDAFKKFDQGGNSEFFMELMDELAVKE
ncbi:BTB/POZ protein [Jimgerdemannia flammicorona]|uniref:BTB/POZ protein n=2 Tax=Jimgerdemannia flammicorona TaxID=994334 RepID=A0A433D295_9FUNG|nr:BTB/POZ protein [Jimgerdemannia flammicorona]RUS25962.1 BTB/POZ protein [Jimgerdemannia flammicorona]